MNQVTQKIVTRLCPYNPCNVKVEIVNPHDIEGLGAIETKFCDFHQAVYNRRQVIVKKLITKYNEKKIEDKFGRIRKFSHYSELANYLYSHRRSTFNKIEMQAVNFVKKKFAKNSKVCMECGGPIRFLYGHTRDEHFCSGKCQMDADLHH